MKFTVKKGELADALADISHALPSNPLVPALENIRVKGENGLLKLAACNNLLSWEVSVSAQNIEDGGFLIEGSKLVKLVNSLPEQPIIFDFSPEKRVVVLQCESGNFTFHTEALEFYPELPQPDKVKPSMFLKGEELSPLKAAMKFVHKDDIAFPSLTGVNVKGENGYLQVGSCDMLKGYISTHRTDFEGEFTVKPALCKAIPDFSAYDVEVNGNHIFLTNLETAISCRLIDESYPKIRSIIPEGKVLSATFDRKQFMGVLKRALLFTDNDLMAVKLIQDEEGSFSLTSYDEISESESEQVIDSEEKDLGFPPVKFNASNVLSIISDIKTEKVVWSYFPELTNSLLYPSGQEESELYLLAKIA